MQNSGSGSGHNTMVITEAVARGIVVDGVENDEEQCLWLSGSRISVNLLYAFLDYKPLIGKDDKLGGSIM